FPMAEDMHAELFGKLNLGGAARFWRMLIWLRPYFFQCAAVIYHTCPNSSLLHLPALKHRDVRVWMKTTAIDHLKLLKAASGDPISRLEAENSILNASLKPVNLSLNQM